MPPGHARRRVRQGSDVCTARLQLPCDSGNLSAKAELRRGRDRKGELGGVLVVAAHRWWSRHGRLPAQWCLVTGLGAATIGSVRDVVADGAGVAVTTTCVADNDVVVEGSEQHTVRTQRRGSTENSFCWPRRGHGEVQDAGAACCCPRVSSWAARCRRRGARGAGGVGARRRWLGAGHVQVLVAGRGWGWGSARPVALHGRLDGDGCAGAMGHELDVGVAGAARRLRRCPEAEEWRR